MEEYPNACKPDPASFVPTYFQIKDETTGLVLEVKDGQLSFAESNGLSNQMWFQYREWNSEAAEGEVHIMNRLLGYGKDVLEVKGTVSDDYREVVAFNNYWLKATVKHQMWTILGGKIISSDPNYGVLTVKDGKLVALKCSGACEAETTTLVISEAPEQEYPLAIKGDQCTEPPPPPEGKFE